MSIPIKNSMQQKILSKSAKPISTADIEQFLTEIHDPPRDIYLIKGMANKVMQPNQVLVQTINTAYKINDLISIALALRHGANPNLYIDSQDIGKVHILAYTYYKLSQSDRTPEMLDNVISLLILAGSSIVNPVYSSDVTAAKDYSKTESVNTWLETQNYQIPDINLEQESDTKFSIGPSPDNDIDSSTDSKALISTESESISNQLKQKRSRLGIILNDINLVQKEYFDPVTAIISHGNKVLDHFKNEVDGQQVNKDDNIPINYYYYKDSVDFLNYTSFKFLLKQGYKPGYVMLNYIISAMVKYKQENDSISYTQLYYMIMESIEHGVAIDTQQFAIITKNDSKGSVKINQAYNKPRWEKYCKTNTGREEYLGRLAYTLGLQPEQDQDKLCQELRKVAQVNPEDYIKAFIKRQQNRIANNVSDSQEYVKNSNKVVTKDNLCVNRSVGKYPYLYNDLDLAYYKDSADNVWCFTSDMFEQIRKTERNPITQEILPNSVLQQINNQRNTLKRLGLLNNGTTALTVTEGLAELNKTDKIESTEVQRRVEALQKLAKLYCNNSVCMNGILQLELLNGPEMVNLINKWGIPVISIGLDKIIPELQLNTFIFILYTILSNNPNRMEQIFTEIQDILRNKYRS